MKAYLAGPYAARDKIRSYANDLEAIGIQVTSSWLNDAIEVNEGTTGPAAELSDAEVRKHALRDLADIDKSTVLVLFTAVDVISAFMGGSSGGRHVETGYALAKGLSVLVVGEPENVFHRLGPHSSVYVEPDWHSAVVSLAGSAITEAREEPRPAP